MVLNVVATAGTGRSESKADYSVALGEVTRPRIGVVKNYKATHAVRSAFDKAVEVLHSLGYESIDIEVPFTSATLNLDTIEQDRQTITGSLFKNIAVLILPTTTDVTPRISDVKKSKNPQAVSPDNTFFCNYYGVPAISVPCGLSNDGLPLAFQVVGPQWSDGAVLNLAHSFQQTADGAPQHPIP
jgi:aspartyl-tRNA(Asn)/glutamyl-tRNA(Gln) amidotransferase subunit A